MPTALIACADATGVVKERKEQNNCKGSGSSVTLPGGPPPPGKVNVSATATTGGTVAASGVTGGTCAGTFCTLTSGAGAVTFTPTPAAGYRFGALERVHRATPGPRPSRSRTPRRRRPARRRSCKQVTISWTVVVLPAPLGGIVAGVASHGTCTATNPLTGAGSCLVDAGVGTVTLTATPLLPILPFKGWSGAACDEHWSTRVVTFTEPGHRHRLHGDLHALTESVRLRVVRRQQLVDGAHPPEGGALPGAEVALLDDPVELLDQRVVEAVRVQQRAPACRAVRAAAR